LGLKLYLGKGCRPFGPSQHDRWADLEASVYPPT
jgi:hypothetical protein